MKFRKLAAGFNFPLSGTVIIIVLTDIPLNFVLEYLKRSRGEGGEVELRDPAQMSISSLGKKLAYFHEIWHKN
jgi:hypothetical protein